MNTPASRVTLTSKLLFEFLGGTIVVKNPDCWFRGPIENLSLAGSFKGTCSFSKLENLPVYWIQILFEHIEEIRPDPDKPFSAEAINPQQNKLISFETDRPVGWLRGNHLTIRTTMREEIELKKPDSY